MKNATTRPEVKPPTDRSAIIAAVAAVLDERAGECREEHGAIAARVADRLGLVERDPMPSPPPVHATTILAERADGSGARPPREQQQETPRSDRSSYPINRRENANPESKSTSLDALGTGVFVRRISDWPIEILSRFGWAAVAVISGGRGALNRDPAWWADARAAGVRMVGMDWMPDPDHVGTHEEDAIAWAAEHGAICWLADYEAPWLRASTPLVSALVNRTRERSRKAGLAAGLTSLAVLPPSRTCEVLVTGLPDLSIPQPYDRYGAYEPDYAARCVDRWQRLGAQRIAVGRGAFVDPDGVGPEKARWRTPQEIERHRATTPPGTAATCWWPPAGRPSAAVVDAIVRA